MIESLLAFMLSCLNCEITYTKQSDPMTYEQVIAKLGQNDLPIEYVWLWSDVSAVEISQEDCVHFFSLNEIDAMNEMYQTSLPKMFFFGDNGGGKLYAFDPKNNWAHGKNAVYMVPADSLDRKSARFISEDLFACIWKLNEGKSFLNLPTLE